MPFIELKDVEEKEIMPGFVARMVHTDNMTFAYWDIKAGSGLPEHSHMHEQVATINEGEFEMIIEGVSHILKPGDVAVIPGNAVHSGKAITDCKILDVFYPIREDYQVK